LLGGWIFFEQSFLETELASFYGLENPRIWQTWLAKDLPHGLDRQRERSEQSLLPSIKMAFVRTIDDPTSPLKLFLG
jgi:hypothetical protein